MVSSPPKLRVFFDADVIFAGAASPVAHRASTVALRMSEITLIHGIASQQAITEVERNLTAKLPAKLPEFHLLVSRCLEIVSDPASTDLPHYSGQADPKDLPILVAALQADCSYLLTFNLRHYNPTDNTITVQRPGTFVLTLRHLMSQGFK